MGTYNVEIEGKHDFDQINLQIAGEEAGASEFQSSRVTPVNNRPTNVVTFLEHDDGTIPNQLTIVKDGEPQPPGTERVWAGVMLVKNAMTAVVGYRLV